MTMGNLYEKMKDVLKVFGLRFHDMDLVDVKFHKSQVTFSYQNQTYTCTSDDLSGTHDPKR